MGSKFTGANKSQKPSKASGSGMKSNTGKKVC
jgi:hypothetical protein